MYVFNLINFTKLHCLLATFFNTQKTFQRYLNVVVSRMMWRRDVGQCQMNAEKLCMSTLKFRTLNNVESALSISVFIWTTSNNVVIFNVEFQNVDQRRNYVVNMTKSKRAKKYFWALYSLFPFFHKVLKTLSFSVMVIRIEDL